MSVVILKFVKYIFDICKVHRKSISQLNNIVFRRTKIFKRFYFEIRKLDTNVLGYDIYSTIASVNYFDAFALYKVAQTASYTFLLFRSRSKTTKLSNAREIFQRANRADKSRRAVVAQYFLRTYSLHKIFVLFG